MAKVPDWQIDDKNNSGTSLFGSALKFYPGVGFVREVVGTGGRAGRVFNEIIDAGGLDPVIGAMGSLKRLIPIDANNFQINQQAPNKKWFASKFIRTQGTNDAGTAHETWRKGEIYIVDAIDSLISAGGWQNVAASTGAQDYARNRGTPVNKFGGSVHGGQTILASSEYLYMDGVQVTGLAQVEGRIFEIRGATPTAKRLSRITWSDDGSTADVAEALILSDMKTELTVQHTSAASMGTLDFATCGLVGVRYTRLTYGANVVDMSTPNADYDMPVGTRSFRLTDPISGDYCDVEFTIDVTVNRLHVLWSPTNSFSKWYVTAPTGVVSPINVTQKTTYFLGTPTAPVLPATDSFTGSALDSSWYQVFGTAPGADLVVSGGEAVITNPVSGGYRWTKFIGYEPGTYHIELDYKTDTAQTGLVMYVVRANAGSVSNPIRTDNLNSLAGTTLAYDITITAGQSPYIMFNTGVAGRITRLRELRITKTS